MPDTLTVSQFVEVVNISFDAVGPLQVEGEVADFKIVHNKWVTFQLKDEESTVPCFMTVWQLRTQLEDGMVVRVSGSPRLRNKGFFSFVIETVTPVGEGMLRRAFELLKAKLEKEGLFAAERKRALPRFPEHIAFITSPQGAAYSDFLKVLKGRIGGLTISFIPSQVQGEDAVDQLLRALEIANTDIADLDAIVMVRGGGSLEDLQAFNDEKLVRSVAASRTPTIVGIGHEKDTTLAELAADLRASTPSNAAELLVRSREEMESSVLALSESLTNTIRQHIQRQRSSVERNIHILSTATRRAVTEAQQTIAMIGVVGNRFKEHVMSLRHRVTVTARMLESLSPHQTLRRGYSITKNAKGAIIRRAADARPDDTVLTIVHDGTFRSRVTRIDA